MSGTTRAGDAGAIHLAKPVARPGALALRRRLSPRLQIVGSAALGQLVAMALSPLLAHVYAPEVFGQFVFFSTVFNVLNIGLALRFEQAVPYCRGAAQTRATAWLALQACLSLASLCLAALALAWLAGVTDRSVLLALAVVSAAGSLVSRLAMLMLARWRRTALMAAANLLRPVGVGLLQIGGGWFAGTVGAMASMHALANGLSALLLMAAVPGFARGGKRPGRAALVDAARLHRRFVLFNLPQNLVFVLSDAALPLLLLHTHGAAAAGLFWFATRFTTAPTQVFVDSLRGLVGGELSRLAAQRRPLMPWCLKTSALMAAPFVAAACGLALVGGPVFEFFFGVRWAAAGVLAAWQFAYAAVNAAGAPLIAALPLVQRQHWHLAAEVLTMIAKVAVCLALSGAGLAQSVAGALCTAMLGYLAFYALVARALHGARPEARAA